MKLIAKAAKEVSVEIKQDQEAILKALGKSLKVWKLYIHHWKIVTSIHDFGTSKSTKPNRTKQSFLDRQKFTFLNSKFPYFQSPFYLRPQGKILEKRRQRHHVIYCKSPDIPTKKSFGHQFVNQERCFLPVSSNPSSLTLAYCCALITVTSNIKSRILRPFITKIDQLIQVFNMIIVLPWLSPSRMRRRRNGQRLFVFDNERPPPKWKHVKEPHYAPCGGHATTTNATRKISYFLSK